MGEINWHISAIRVAKLMPRRFLDYFSSVQFSMVNRFDYRKVTDNTVMIR